MIDNFEFSDAKQVRKTLLITSFIGICFKSLVKHSTENIEFFGFNIPIKDSSIIPNFIGYLIMYFLVALLIRYLDEKLQKKVTKFRDRLKNIENDFRERENLRLNEDAKMYFEHLDRELMKTVQQSRFTNVGITLLDFIFPVAFGLFSLYVIFRK